MKNFIDKLGHNIVCSSNKDYDNKQTSELETVNKLDLLPPQDL